jgi:hypothetical protein
MNNSLAHKLIWRTIVASTSKALAKEPKNLRRWRPPFGACACVSYCLVLVNSTDLLRGFNDKHSRLFSLFLIW